MRSGRRPSGPAAWLAEQRVVLMPFIAGAIRRTDRVAVAMDSRGFAGTRPRTHLRTLPIGRGDIAMLLVTLAVALGIVTLSALAGSLRLWTGVLAGRTECSTTVDSIGTEDARPRDLRIRLPARQPVLGGLV